MTSIAQRCEYWTARRRMRNRVDPRTRWVFHVIGQLVVGDSAMAIDRCLAVNYRLDHEQNIEALRSQIVASVNLTARGEDGALIVGEKPRVAFVFAAHPRLVRTFLAEDAPQVGPVAVQ